MLEALGQGPCGRPLSIYTLLLHVDVDISVRSSICKMPAKQAKSTTGVRIYPYFERPPHPTYFERWGEGDSYLKLVLHTVGPQV